MLLETSRQLQTRMNAEGETTKIRIAVATCEADVHARIGSSCYLHDLVTTMVSNGSAEGVNLYAGESLRQKDLCRTHLWRAFAMKRITQEETWYTPG